MSERSIGRLFVAVQAILLVALVVLPGDDQWPTPPWVDVIGAGLIVLGLVIVAVAALGLGQSLTATPVPNQGGLITLGLYQHVRHPIYSGVLCIVTGITVRSGSFVTLVVAAVTVVFFHLKARWEEARLAERYPEYATYARVTPRFVPAPWRSS